MRQDVLPSWKMSGGSDSMAKSSLSVPMKVPPARAAAVVEHLGNRAARHDRDHAEPRRSALPVHGS